MEKKKSDILRNIIKYGLPVALSVCLCFYLYSKIDVNVIVEEIRHCDYVWIAIALIVSIFSHIFRAMRWRIQLDALDIRVPLPPLVWSIFGTYAVNLLAPRLGELWRTGYIAKRQDAKFTTVFGSMVCDRLADAATVLLLTLVTFFIARPAFVAFGEKYPETYQGMLNMLHSPWLWGLAVVGIALVVWLFTTKSTHKWVVYVRQSGTSGTVLQWLQQCLTKENGCFLPPVCGAAISFSFISRILHFPLQPTLV